MYLIAAMLLMVVSVSPIASKRSISRQRVMGSTSRNNEREFYAKLLTFLQKQIGGRAPVIAATPAKD